MLGALRSWWRPPSGKCALACLRVSYTSLSPSSERKHWQARPVRLHLHSSAHQSGALGKCVCGRWMNSLSAGVPVHTVGVGAIVQLVGGAGGAAGAAMTPAGAGRAAQIGAVAANHCLAQGVGPLLGAHCRCMGRVPGDRSGRLAQMAVCKTGGWSADLTSWPPALPALCHWPATL